MSGNIQSADTLGAFCWHALGLLVSLEGMVTAIF